MKRNIDLTINRDFQKPITRIISINPMTDELSFITVDNSNDDHLIKDSESETNFPTGSFKNINNKLYRLKMTRDLDNIECSCDRCGGYLYIKQNTLCNKCETQLEEELVEIQTLSLFNIKK